MEPRPLLELLEIAQQRERWKADVAKNVRTARRQAGLSQEGLAAALSVPQSYISKVENGGGISSKTLRSLIELLGQTGGTHDDQDEG